VSPSTETRSSWLSKEDLETHRARMPVVYVDAVPVRVDTNGMVTRVGTLLGMQPDGSISRAVVSGRVLYGERIRDALVRHLEKDLGPVALPAIPPSPTPFTVVEYFPDPEITGFHDPRQHAVSLAFVVPVAGDCRPSQDALDLAWLTPEESLRADVRSEMSSGHDRLVRMALAYVGLLT
jgi:ADP-ribose pyrophosphatase YjhB (NUDIX family)